MDYELSDDGLMHRILDTEADEESQEEFIPIDEPLIIKDESENVIYLAFNQSHPNPLFRQYLNPNTVYVIQTYSEYIAF